MTSHDYNGDLNKASTSVRTLVRTYDAAASSLCTTAMDALVEGIHVQAMSGERLEPVDGLWLEYLCRRHAASKMDDTTHDNCVETTLALQGLALQAIELQLPTLGKTLEGLAADLYSTHGVCINKAHTASQAQTEADDPYKLADEFVADMTAAAATLAQHLPKIVGDGISMGVGIGLLFSDLLGNRKR